MPTSKDPKDEQPELPINEGTAASIPATPATPEAELVAAQPEAPKNNDHAPLAASYKTWFLDYASYVILDRAVPHIDDGLKPVQRRILHTFWEQDDGRFHKVANIVGACMRFHPHGDASIGAALVGMGQRGYLVEPQGNFGNLLTGSLARPS